MKILLSIVCLFSVLPSYAQEVREEIWTHDGKQLSYAVYEAAPQPGRIVYAFYNGGESRWDPTAWVTELRWFADSFNAIVVAPSGDEWTYNPSTIAGFNKEIMGSAKPVHTSFIAVGTGATAACRLAGHGITGIFISPQVEEGIGSLETEGAFSILGTHDGDSAHYLADSLMREGQWVDLQMTVSDDPFFVHDYKDVYFGMQRWIDSVNALLNDSTALSQVRTELISEVPEVLRQGRLFKIKILVAKEGDFAFKVVDMAAQTVQEVNRYLGKGGHEVIILSKELDWGVYTIEIDGPAYLSKHKIMIRG